MRDKGIKIRDTLKQHILNNKKEYIVFYYDLVFWNYSNSGYQ